MGITVNREPGTLHGTAYVHLKGAVHKGNEGLLKAVKASTKVHDPHCTMIWAELDTDNFTVEVFVVSLQLANTVRTFLPTLTLL